MSRFGPLPLCNTRGGTTAFGSSKTDDRILSFSAPPAGATYGGGTVYAGRQAGRVRDSCLAERRHIGVSPSKLVREKIVQPRPRRVCMKEFWDQAARSVRKNIG